MSDEGGGHDERWVISYADLVTLLLGFFIILYSTAELDVSRFEQLRFAFADAFNVDVKQGQNGDSAFFQGGSGIVSGGALGLPDPQLELIKNRVDRKLEESGFALGTIVVGRQQDDIVIRLADHLLFPSASAELQPEARDLMQVVADVLQTVPNAVRVEGHTDNVPVGTAAYPTNWELSSARATAVLRSLVDAGVAPTRLSAAGYAEFRPVASNATPEGRAQNRRADIVIISSPTAAASGVPSFPDTTPVESAPQDPHAPQEGTPGE